MLILQDIHVFLQLSCIGLLEQTEPIPTLKLVSCRKHSSQKGTQFSKGNNVPGAHASKTNGFPWKYVCFVSTTDRPIWKKMSLSPLWKLHLAGSIFFQILLQFSQRHNGLDAACTNVDGFLSRDTCVSSSRLNRPLWNKMSFSPSWKLEGSHMFLLKN
jgi:hypothetical protein